RLAQLAPPCAARRIVRVEHVEQEVPAHRQHGDEGGDEGLAAGPGAGPGGRESAGAHRGPFEPDTVGAACAVMIFRDGAAALPPGRGRARHVTTPPASAGRTARAEACSGTETEPDAGQGPSIEELSCPPRRCLPTPSSCCAVPTPPSWPRCAPT